MLYMCFAAIFGWRPFARPSRDRDDRFDKERELYDQLDEMTNLLAAENDNLAHVLLAGVELMVPWEISADDCGKNVDDLCLRLFSIDLPKIAILGNAGTGKSTMAALLAARLFELRDPADPHLRRIPVRISVASWTQGAGKLQEWILRQLGEQYPDLLTCLDEISQLGLSRSLVREWLFPIFDGLDEIKDPSKFLKKLAIEFTSYPMILTSRIEEYWDAKADAGTSAGVIEVFIKPVAEDEARLYLDEATLSSAASWDAVFASSDAELKRALASPLLLWLMTEVYAHSNDEPTALLALTEPGSVESHLLRNLVPSAFDRAADIIIGPHGGRPAARASPEQAQTTFTYLASGLTRQGRTTICWWRLPELTPRLGVLLGSAIVGGAAAGLLASSSVIVPMLTTALILGAWFGAGFGRGYSSARKRSPLPGDRFGFGGTRDGEDPDLRSHLWRLGGALLGTAAFWAVTQLVKWQSSVTVFHQDGIAHQLYRTTLLERLTEASIACVIVAFLGGHLLGLILTSLRAADLKNCAARAATPREALKKDAENTFKIAPIAYIISASAIIAVFYPAFHWHYLSMEFATATVSVMTYGLVFPSWPRYRVAHLLLATFGLLPLPYMNFLEDAHDLGLLRQTGISYQFRHERLRISLANKHRDQAQASRNSQERAQEIQAEGSQHT